MIDEEFLRNLRTVADLAERVDKEVKLFPGRSREIAEEIRRLWEKEGRREEYIRHIAKEQRERRSTMDEKDVMSARIWLESAVDDERLRQLRDVFRYLEDKVDDYKEQLRCEREDVRYNRRLVEKYGKENKELEEKNQELEARMRDLDQIRWASAVHYFKEPGAYVGSSIPSLPPCVYTVSAATMIRRFVETFSDGRHIMHTTDVEKVNCPACLQFLYANQTERMQELCKHREELIYRIENFKSKLEAVKKALRQAHRKTNETWEELRK